MGSSSSKLWHGLGLISLWLFLLSFMASCGEKQAHKDPQDPNLPQELPSPREDQVRDENEPKAGNEIPSSGDETDQNPSNDTIDAAIQAPEDINDDTPLVKVPPIPEDIWEKMDEEDRENIGHPKIRFDVSDGAIPDDGFVNRYQQITADMPPLHSAMYVLQRGFHTDLLRARKDLNILVGSEQRWKDIAKDQSFSIEVPQEVKDLYIETDPDRTDHRTIEEMKFYIEQAEAPQPNRLYKRLEVFRRLVFLSHTLGQLDQCYKTIDSFVHQPLDPSIEADLKEEFELDDKKRHRRLNNWGPGGNIKPFPAWLKDRRRTILAIGIADLKSYILSKQKLLAFPAKGSAVLYSQILLDLKNNGFKAECDWQNTATLLGSPSLEGDEGFSEIFAAPPDEEKQKLLEYLEDENITEGIYKRLKTPFDTALLNSWKQNTKLLTETSTVINYEDDPKFFLRLATDPSLWVMAQKSYGYFNLIPNFNLGFAYDDSVSLLEESFATQKLESSALPKDCGVLNGAYEQAGCLNAKREKSRAFWVSAGYAIGIPLAAASLMGSAVLVPLIGETLVMSSGIIGSGLVLGTTIFDYMDKEGVASNNKLAFYSGGLSGPNFANLSQSVQQEKSRWTHLLLEVFILINYPVKALFATFSAIHKYAVQPASGYLNKLGNSSHRAWGPTLERMKKLGIVLPGLNRLITSARPGLSKVAFKAYEVIEKTITRFGKIIGAPITVTEWAANQLIKTPFVQKIIQDPNYRYKIMGDFAEKWRINENHFRFNMVRAVTTDGTIVLGTEYNARKDQFEDEIFYVFLNVLSVTFLYASITSRLYDLKPTYWEALHPHYAKHHAGKPLAGVYYFNGLADPNIRKEAWKAFSKPAAEWFIDMGLIIGYLAGGMEFLQWAWDPEKYDKNLSEAATVVGMTALLNAIYVATSTNLRTQALFGDFNLRKKAAGNGTKTAEKVDEAMDAEYAFLVKLAEKEAKRNISAWGVRNDLLGSLQYSWMLANFAQKQEFSAGESGADSGVIVSAYRSDATLYSLHGSLNEL